MGWETVTVLAVADFLKILSTSMLLNHALACGISQIP
jgi:hypothetical protein